MSTVFGVHTGLQNTTDRRAAVDLWRRIEDARLRLDLDLGPLLRGRPAGGYDCHEAVACHAALACSTSRVRCGSLVYCAGYRHPAVLANAIATIDHLSGGRADLGLGAGWAQLEYDAYGIPFPTPGARLDLLEEAAASIRGLLRDETTTFAGEHFSSPTPGCEPRPVQAELPIWIGGGGEKRTLRIVARYADGWNVPFVAPEDFAAQARRAAPSTARPSGATRPRSARGQRRPRRGTRTRCRRSSATWPTSCAPACVIGTGERAGRPARPLRRRRRRPGQHRAAGPVGPRRLLDLAAEAIAAAPMTLRPGSRAGST